MSNIGDQLVLLFVPNVFSVFTLVSSIRSLYSLGKSKTRMKKESRSIPILEKLCLIGYVKRCNFYPKTARRLCQTYWAYGFFWMIGIVLVILSYCIPPLEYICSIWTMIKILVFDIPLVFYIFIMTKYCKQDGRIMWRWEK